MVFFFFFFFFFFVFLAGAPAPSKHSSRPAGPRGPTRGRPARRRPAARAERAPLARQADEWEIDATEIELGPRIGIGSFGEVYRGAWRHTDVAVKRFLEQDICPQLMEARAPAPPAAGRPAQLQAELCDVAAG